MKAYWADRGYIISRTGWKNTNQKHSCPGDQCFKVKQVPDCGSPDDRPSLHYWYHAVWEGPNRVQKCQDTPVSRTTKCKYFQSHTNRNGFMHPKGKSDNDNRSCSQHPNVPETDSFCLVPEQKRIANTIRYTALLPMRDTNPFL